MNCRRSIICAISFVVSVSIFKPATGQSSIALSYATGSVTGKSSYGISGFSLTFKNQISKKLVFGLRADRFSAADQLRIDLSSNMVSRIYDYDITTTIGIVHANLQYQLLNSPFLRLFGSMGMGGTFSSKAAKLTGRTYDQNPYTLGGEKSTQGFFSISPGVDFEVLPFRKKTFGFCGTAYYCKGLTKDLNTYEFLHVTREFATDFYAITAGLMVNF